jgi:alpha-tubulin suppressor-like RCC1 family protein
MQQSSSKLLGQLAFLALACCTTVLGGCSGGVDGEDGAGWQLGTVTQELAGTSACPAGYTIIQGTAGNDVLNFSAATTSHCILGNGGNDTITGGSAADWIAGGMGNDIINGGPGNDFIAGEPGDDTIHGNDGVDQIDGGDGVDQLFGDANNDFLFGSTGNDELFGGVGDDELYGQDQADTLHGDDGNDRLFGGINTDTLEGGNGNDILNGDDGADHLWGDFINNAVATTGSVVDTLNGGSGDDDLHGGPGNDILFGNDGNDSLEGDDGDERLVGGTGGTKTLSGGNGNDLAKGNGTGPAAGDENNDVLVVVGSSDGGNGTDACGGTSCEIAEPPSFCTSVAGQCSAGMRCALEVGVCIFCQSNSECAAGQECVPTVGCTAKEVVCTDGVDNDGDTAIDCADTDCAQDLACQTGVTRLGNGGTFHNCITNSSGEVKCWGRNNCAQLGYFAPDHATTQRSLNPTVIANTLADTPKMVRGGSFHSCALLNNGGVQCWGRNLEGQLGNGTTTSACSIVPVNVSGMSTGTHLSAGGAFSCVVTNTGGVSCWGQNNFGQLGDNSQTNRSSPVSVQGLGGTAVEVAVGIQHACARLTNGTVKCWGRNHVGQIGNNSTAELFKTAQTVGGGLGSVAQISVGAEFSCARRASGTAFCWGANYAGQLGIGTTDGSDHATPVQVPGIVDATEIGSGHFHSCIKRATQGLRCWGKNTVGQLGNGSTAAAVATPTVLNILDATQFGMGQHYTCTRRTDGTLTCWGENVFGQIGDGTTTNRPSPTAVPNVP